MTGESPDVPRVTYLPICGTCEHFKAGNCRKFPNGYPTEEMFLPSGCCIGHSLRSDIGREEETISDKFITDSILSENEFFCDKENPDLPLYVWVGNHWSASKAEAVILQSTSEILKNRADRAKMAIGRTTDFIKGQSMGAELERKPPELVAFKNYLYNVRTGEKVPHAPKYFYINLIPHDHVPLVECPNFLKWLKEVIRPEDLDFVQEWMGYLLFDKITEAAFLFLIGTGQNGKTVLMTLITLILGEVNVSTISLASLSYDPFERAGIEGKLAILGDDIGTTEIKNAGILNSVSAGSRITIQRKYGQPHDISPYCKPMFACNVPPNIVDPTEATKIRLKTLEFVNTFTKHPNLEKGEKPARDRDELMAELTAEIPGIINWALAGLKRLIENKFKFSTSRSTEATWEFYHKKANPAISYVEACWDMTGEEHHVIERGKAYADFQKWVEEEKLGVKLTRRQFYESLRQEGFETPTCRQLNGGRGYMGVKCSRIAGFEVPLSQKKLSIGEGKKEFGYSATVEGNGQTKICGKCGEATEAVIYAEDGSQLCPACAAKYLGRV